MTSISLSAPPSRLWTVAQGTGVVLTLVLVSALVLAPVAALGVLWDMVIPLLPAVFLINPMLWRNVCPLATLNQVGGTRAERKLRGAALDWSWAVGIILLVLMVPARRFLFNEQGAVLAGTIVAIALLALGTGLVFSRRAGFCNSICPVLPVEKLYGQFPLIAVPSAVCPDCNGCAARGCVDLTGGRSMEQSVGRGHEGWRWLLTPMGGFTAVFPGFVIGYFTTVNGSLGTAAAVYGHVALWMLGSGAVVAALVLAFRLSTAVALPLLGILALGLYYWYAAPGLAEAYGFPELGPAVVRGTAFLLITVWLIRAVPQLRATAAA